MYVVVSGLAMQPGTGSQQMAGYPCLSHPTACRVQPRLLCVHLRFWYITSLTWYIILPTWQVFQAPLRLWSTPVCCFYETFVRIDLTWEYSKLETFVPGRGEAFGSRWCPDALGGGRVLCAGGWQWACQPSAAVPSRTGWLWDGRDPTAQFFFSEKLRSYRKLRLWQGCIHAQRWASSAC